MKYVNLMLLKGCDEMNTNEERLDYLICKFKENTVYRDINVPENYNDKRRLLRSLMNVRMPAPMDKEVIRVHDEFLKKEAEEKGIVKLSEIKTIGEEGGRGKYSNIFSIWQGDITRLEIDAIVNAANSAMLGCFIPCHGCIDNAIHSSAGIELRNECNKIMNEKRKLYGKDYEEETGKAIITRGYNLPCRYVIHTVGPIVRGGLNKRLCSELEGCYKSVLKCAAENNVKSIAFCCISTGEFHFPNKKAAEIAVNTVRDFLDSNDFEFERIIFNVFKDEDRKIYENIFQL